MLTRTTSQFLRKIIANRWVNEIHEKLEGLEFDGAFATRLFIEASLHKLDRQTSEGLLKPLIRDGIIVDISSTTSYNEKYHSCKIEFKVPEVDFYNHIDHNYNFEGSIESHESDDFWGYFRGSNRMVEEFNTIPSNDLEELTYQGNLTQQCSNELQSTSQISQDKKHTRLIWAMVAAAFLGVLSYSINSVETKVLNQNDDVNIVNTHEVNPMNISGIEVNQEQ